MKNFFLLLAFISFCATKATAQVTGTKTIPGNYATLAAAITDLNTVGVGAGGATINIAAGYTETAPSGGYLLGTAVLNGTLSAANPLVIQKSGAGANPVFTAPVGTSPNSAAVNANTDGIIKLLGVDYTTLNGLSFQESAANTTSITCMEWGIAMLNRTNTAGAMDGCQNNTIQNCSVTLNRNIVPVTNGSPCYGIYVAHNLAADKTALTITAAADLNNNNKFYGNTITNVNDAIFVSGFAATTPFTFYDQGNDVGGSSAATGNTLNNWGSTTAGSYWTAAFGVYLNNQNNGNASYNTISNTANGGLPNSGSTYPIYLVGTNSTFTANNNTLDNTIGAATTGYVLYSIASLSTGSNFTATNNNITASGAAGSAVSQNYTIASAGANYTVTGNTIAINQAVVGTNVAGVYSAGTGTVLVNNNNITAATSATITGTFYGILLSGLAAGGETATGNIFNNISYGTTGITYLVYSSSATNNRTITNNSISGSFAKTGAGGTAYGIYAAGAPTGGTAVISGNTMSNMSVTGSAVLYGINDVVTGTTQTINIFNNTVGPATLGSGTSYGINFNGSLAGSVYSNTVKSMSGSGGIFNGIVSNLGLANSVYKNKIYDLQEDGANGVTNGIGIATGTAAGVIKVYNNLVGDLRTPSASAATDAIRGINITSTTANSSFAVSDNTVYLAGASSGTNFSTSALFHTGNATATSGALTLKNNILYNNSTPNGTGVASAFRRSNTNLNNYTASSNNLLFAGAPGANNALFYDGTTSYQTIATYQAAVTPRDAASVTELATPFVSTTGGGATFLHINPAVGTVAESGGTPIAGITDDYDGDTRNATTPDIGADEFAGIVPVACSGTPASGTITGTANICQGFSAILTLNGYPTGSTGISIQWKSSTTAGGPYTNITGATGATYSTGVITPGTTNYYVATVTCANGGGNSTTAEFSVTSNATPTITVNPAAPSICTAGTGAPLTASGASTYVWSPAGGLNATTGATVTANPVATTIYTVTGTSTFGCVNTATVTVTVNTSPTLTSVGASSTLVCSGDAINLTSSGTSNSVTPLINEGFEGGVLPAGWASVNAGTGNLWAVPQSNGAAHGGTKAAEYNWNTTQAGTAFLITPGQVLTAGVTYNISSWYRTSGATFPEKLKITVGTSATAAGQTTVLQDVGTITNTVYAQQTTTFTPVTSGTYYFGWNAYSDPDEFYLDVDDILITAPAVPTYSWTSVPAGFTSAVQNPTGVVTTVNTVYTVTITNPNGGCTATGSVTVNVNNPAPYSVTGGGAYCAGGTGVLVGLSNSETGVNYQLVLNGTTNVGSPVAGTTGSSISFGLQTAAGTYTVVGTRGTCTTNMTGSVTVSINAVPIINFVLTQPTTCTSTNGAIDITVTGGSGPYSYAWVGNGVVAGNEDQTGLTAGTYTVTATNTATNCSTTQVINLNGPGGCNICPTIPTLTANPATAICIGSNVTLTASSLTQMGVTYGIIFKYSTTVLANPYTGGTVIATVPNGSLTAGGTQAATTTNFATNGTYIVYAILSPTPVDPTCRPSASVSVVVNPTPTVNAVTSQTVCNNGAVAAVTFSGAVAGTVYNWTNNTTSTGLAASGTGNIAAFNGTNATTAPVTATITVTPSYTNGGATCTGISTTYTITVNPTATVNAVTNQTVCNNSSVAAINFSSPATGGTIVYNWTNSTPSIGLAASGTGNIAAFNGTNATTAPVTATITVTPSYTNSATCAGTPRTFTITVNPVATVTAVANQAVCNNTSTAAVNFSSPTTGGTIVYNWTNNTPSIGLAASGAGNIAAFTAVNTTTTPVIATITVTPSYTNGATCTGTASTFTITVNPTPAATISYPASPYCSSAGAVTVTRTGTAGGVYSAPAGLSINASTGTVTTTTSTAGTYTVTYTIAAAGGCATFTTTASITITAAPAATLTYGATPICQSSITANPTLTGTTGGVYSSTSGLTINAATGVINPSTSTAGTYTVTYTVAAAGGCAVFSTTASVTINTLSVAPTGATASNPTICGTNGTTNLSVTGGTLGSGASFKWYMDGCGTGAVIGTGATLTGIPVFHTTTFYVRAEGTCNNTTCASVTVNVNPVPVVILTVAQYNPVDPAHRSVLQATVSPAGNYTFHYTKDGVTLANTTSDHIPLTEDSAGTYIVTVTNTATGCSGTSNTVVVVAKQTTNLFISPNPNHGVFTVRYYASSFGAVRMLAVYDGKGARVFTKSVTITDAYTAMNVDISKYGSGSYYVALMDANGKIIDSAPVLVEP